MTRDTTFRVLAAALVFMSLFAGIGAAAAPQTTAAELAIDQPDYVDGEVGTTRAGNGTVYVVRHGQVEIKPQNFDAEDVVGYGVTTSSGELQYNEEFGTFSFDSEDNTGTFELYWEVEQSRVVEANNSTTTEEVTRRYESTVRVDEDQSWTHLPSASLEETREQAANWEEWTAALQSIYGENVDVAQRTSWSVDVNEVRANPFSVLSGGYTGFLVALFITISGVLVLLTFGILHIYSTIQDKIAVHRNETLKADEAEVDERLDELDNEERERRWAKSDYQDMGWTDSVARAYRRIGDTPMKGFLNLSSARTPNKTLEFRLQAMGVDGYVGVVEREELRADGGDDSDVDPAPISSARVVDGSELELEGDEERLELDDDIPTEFLDAIRGDSRTVREYDLTATSAGPGDISVDHAPLELEEWMETLEIQRQDFDSPDEWGKYTREMLEFTLSHPITDEHGELDEVQIVLNEWLDTDDVVGDIFEVPHAKYEAEAMQWAIDQRNAVEEAEQMVESVETGEYA